MVKRHPWSSRNRLMQSDQDDQNIRAWTRMVWVHEWEGHGGMRAWKINYPSTPLSSGKKMAACGRAHRCMIDMSICLSCDCMQEECARAVACCSSVVG
jgi:hypothetical protein